MRTLAAVVALVLVVSACGGSGSTQFDQADSDELFEWCVEHRMNSATDSWQCDEIADLVAVDINEKGLEKDCVLRLVKRAIVVPPEPTRFTSGRDDWSRYPLPDEVNVRLGMECRTGNDLPDVNIDDLESRIDLAEAVACSNLGLEERKAGIRVSEYYEVQAFLLIDYDIAPGFTAPPWRFNFDPQKEPLSADADRFARDLEEAAGLRCPKQTSVVNAFSDWLTGLAPDRPFVRSATTMAYADG
jgi:hypothetical protein